MPQIFKVGDKVRILNASKIINGVSRGLKDGDIYEVVELYLGREYDPIIKLDDGLNFGFMDGDYKYIEKVAEDVTKFKVGDKVRIISTEGQPLAGFEGGDIVSINDAYKKGDGEQRYEVIRSDGTVGFGGNDTFEKVSDKSTKNQRISTLESEVAELKAKVEALEKAQKPTITQSITVKSDADVAEIASKLAKAIEGNRPKSANEQRKAIIAEAKAFVAEQITDGGMRVGDVVMGEYGHLTVNFYVNPEKRTVAFVGKNAYAGNHTQRGTAKCAPDDVFNADIGKAIALGRALGLDVSKFEQAVKPTEFAVGQAFEYDSILSGTRIEHVVSVDEEEARVKSGGFFWNYRANESDFRIIDDTEANY